MNRSIFPMRIGFWGIIASVLLFLAIPAMPVVGKPSTNAKHTNKEQVTRQVAQSWIQIGLKQSERGYFEQAERSLLFAQDYDASLTPTEREQLERLLEECHMAVLKRKHILKIKSSADDLVKQGKLIEAQEHHEQIKDSVLLTAEEKGQVAESLQRIYEQKDKYKRRIAELYEQGMKFYRLGHFEDAREYFAKIDLVLVELSSTSTPAQAQVVEPNTSDVTETVEITEEAEDDSVDVSAGFIDKTELNESPVEPEPEKPSIVAVAEPDSTENKTAGDNDQIQTASDRKRNIVRSYNNAVVTNAVIKAHDYINEGEFKKAKEIIVTALGILGQNRQYLGEELFTQYSSKLQEIIERIDSIVLRRNDDSD